MMYVDPGNNGDENLKFDDFFRDNGEDDDDDEEEDDEEEEVGLPAHPLKATKKGKANEETIVAQVDAESEDDENTEKSKNKTKIPATKEADNKGAKIREEDEESGESEGLVDTRAE